MHFKTVFIKLFFKILNRARPRIDDRIKIFLIGWNDVFQPRYEI